MGDLITCFKSWSFPPREESGQSVTICNAFIGSIPIFLMVSFLMREVLQVINFARRGGRKRLEKINKKMFKLSQKKGKI